MMNGAEYGNCHGCQAALLPSKGGPPRKWCSQKCRQAQYGKDCEVCGARTNGSFGRAKAATVCQKCIEDKARLRRAEIAGLWDAGFSLKSICEVLGLTEGHVRGAIQHIRDTNEYELSLHRARNRENWPEIRRRLDAGESKAEIARSMGTSAENIYCQVRTMRLILDNVHST